MSSWKIHSGIKYYFCTTSITEWYPVFIKNEYFLLVIDSLKYCQINKGLSIHAYVIMLNHIHLIISAENPQSIPNIFRDFKRYTSSKITSLLIRNKQSKALKVFRETARKSGNNQEHKVWQPGYHPIGIQSERFFKQKRNYIHQNPVRKEYVIEPEHWRFSSARNYTGCKNTPIQINKLY
jgi:REP element-mobilizing transposase RayT